MSLILSGSDGLSDVDGTAAAPAIRGTDANTGIFFPAADTIAFAEGGVEAARFDSAGNMGLGATPSAWGSNNRTIDMYGIGSFSSFSNGSGGYELDVSLNAYNSASGWRYKVSSYAVALYQQAAGSHIWYNAASGTAGNAISFTQAMTLDASGNFQVGGATTSVTRLQVLADAVNAAVCTQVSTTSSFGHMIFRNPNGQVGGITTSGSSTAFNTSSDYRLKEAIAPMTGALAKVALLKPVTYKWKVDGSDGQGFIAHELDEVVSGCVTGEKDAVDADGNPQYQGIDTSFLVATLTAAIQEQQALITALTTRITALEAA